MARITQGYVSKSIMDFPFHEVYHLDDYNSVKDPCVFFGMYRFEDMCLADQHLERIEPHIFWTGQDALTEKTWPKNIGKNVTAHPKVFHLLKSQGYNCKLVKPAAFLNEQKPQVLGKSIYAYCPNGMPEYHGKKIIDQLQKEGYDILIGDGSFSQSEWRNIVADQFYLDCFIGLCLSEFAGGGGSIIEMGLRGMKVVTNVFDLPNCIPWNSIEDIKQAIEDQIQYIGHSNPGLAQYVWDGLDHKHEWLNI